MAQALKLYLKPYTVHENIYSLPVEIFKQLDIKQWEFNRPPDLNRVLEIKEWMTQFNRIDGIISLAYLHGLVCYDGNHRRLAIDNQNTNILVHVLWDANNEIVTSEFKRINKSVCVPEIYVTENDNKLEIVEFVSRFRNKYCRVESPSSRPQRPNYNRDNLTNEITRLVRELGVHVSQLETKLEILNNELSRKDRSKLSEKTIKKCIESGLWLFAWSSSIDNSLLV